MIGPSLFEPEAGAGVGLDAWEAEAGAAVPMPEVVVTRVLEPPVPLVMTEVMIKAAACVSLLDRVEVSRVTDGSVGEALFEEEAELEVEEEEDEAEDEDEDVCAAEGEADEDEEELAAEPPEPPEPPEPSAPSAPPGARGNWARGNLSLEV